MTGATSDALLKRCLDLGFSAAPIDPATGVEDGVVVAVPFDHPSLKPLVDEGYRLSPSGRKHALIRPAEPAPKVVVVENADTLDKLLDFALLPDHIQELGERLQRERDEAQARVAELQETERLIMAIPTPAGNAYADAVWRVLRR